MIRLLIDTLIVFALIPFAVVGFLFLRVAVGALVTALRRKGE